jgi:hypothetical protein
MTNPNPPRPHCPALLICQGARTTRQRLVDLLGVMNAIGITQFPANVTFTVHFALTEGEGLYRLALFLEKGAGATPGDRFQLWSGDVSLRHRDVVHEQSLPVIGLERRSGGLPPRALRQWREGRAPPAVDRESGLISDKGFGSPLRGKKRFRECPKLVHYLLATISW